MSPRAVLLGAGHAHLFTLKRAAAFARAGIELVLVAPAVFWYSGLATGMLAGIYPPVLDQVDVGALAMSGGGTFVRAHATGLDVAARMVHRDVGPPLSYDVISCNLGSEVPLGGVPGARDHGYAVKPVRNLWNLRQALEARLQTAAPERPLRIVVAGGGATGCEVAANVRRLVDDHRGQARIKVLARGKAVLEGMPAAAAAAVRRALRRRRVEIVTRSPVVEVRDGVVVTADGRLIPFDFLVHALGLVPPSLLRMTGLPTDVDGALRVDRYLRSIADPRVFGGGDCIAFEHTGSDRGLIRRLPNTTGLKDVVILQRAHHTCYDNQLTDVGVRLIDVVTPADVQRAVGTRTALMFFMNVADGDGRIPRRQGCARRSETDHTTGPGDYWSKVCSRIAKRHRHHNPPGLQPISPKKPALDCLREQHVAQ
jgi:NADH dehydrogenase FAD-containing subunit